MQNSHEKLTDSQLYKLAQGYGLRAKQWMRKFEGLLPEIYKRKLYKRRGFASIHEFSAKLAGMSHEKADKILRLSSQLEDKPTLKALLESGGASYCKIEKVAYIATPETEAAWAEKVLNVPQPALELCVQEARKNNREEVTLQSNFPPDKNTNEFSTISFKINTELEYELRLLKQKLEKEKGEALGFAEVLQELLKAYKSASQKQAQKQAYKQAQKQAQKPEPKRIIQLCPNCIKEKANEVAEWTITKRPIPMAVKHLVAAKQNGKCAFPNCEKPPEIFHHIRRFSLNKNHDPDYIVHLCTSHEQLAHTGLIENEEKALSEWRIQAGVGSAHRLKYRSKAKFKIDEKVNNYRLEPLIAPLAPA